MANRNTWTGISSDDRYVGTADDDILDGDGGDDEILAGTGDDTVEGGPGNDVLYGGDGDDVITDDDLTSTSGQELHGEGGNDSITGGGRIYGGGGDDTITVTAEGDNRWNAYVDGGAGNDTIIVDAPTASINAGAGSDTITLRAETVHDVDAGEGNDTVTLIGDWDRPNLEGDFRLSGGNDSLSIENWTGSLSTFADFRGGSGNDVFVGRDVERANNTYDAFHGDDGQDVITGGSADEYFDGGADADTIDGGGGDDVLYGGAGSDVIVGGAGGDTITGGEGIDSLTGGPGQDIFVFSEESTVDLAGDVVTDFTPGSGGDLLDFRPLLSDLGYTGADPFGDNWLGLEQEGSDLKVILIYGNAANMAAAPTLVTLQDVTLSDFRTQNALPAGPLSNDQVTWRGTSADERYVAGGGNDNLHGDGGHDEILAGSGADTIRGGLGDDVLYGGAGNDLIIDEDLTVTAGQIIHGEGGDDTITGGGQIDGGDGDDIITVTATGDNAWNARVDGGQGNDTIVVDGGEAGAIYAGLGHDTITLHSSTIGHLDAGPGDDVVTLSGEWDRPDYVDFHLAEGNDYLSIQAWIGNLDVTPDLRGGAGDDVFVGRDVTKTNNTYDYFYGGHGQDTITGGNADESFHGAAGEDTISGGGGNDLINGGSENDVISGGAGSDTITGGHGSDTLTGGDGQDIFAYEATNHFFDGSGSFGDVITDFAPGSGGDVLDFRSLFSELGYGGADPFGEGWLQLEHDGSDLKVNLDSSGSGENYSNTITTLQNVTLSDFRTQNALPAGPLSNDQVTWRGTSSDERYVAGSADDVLDGDAGDDEILAGAGADTIEGGAGNDLLYGGAGDDVITDDDLTTTHGQYIYGEGGNDTITGGGRIDGGDGDDTITVTATGDNVWHSRVDGGAGDDTIIVPEGREAGEIFSGAGNDTLTLSASTVHHIGTGEGDDNVTLSGDWDRPDWVEFDLADGNDRLSLQDWTGSLDVTPSFYAGSGGDIYVGRDVYKTNNTYDAFYGEGGSDTITGGDADEYLDGGAGRDLIEGNGGNDVLLGGGGDDLISGGVGADTITGGFGADALTGGNGQDIFVFTSRDDIGDTITDFTPGSGGDVLDLRLLFSELGYTGADPFGDGWLQLEEVTSRWISRSRSLSELQINLDRNGGGDSFSETLVTLDSVILSDFRTENALPAGPLPVDSSSDSDSDLAPTITSIDDLELIEDSRGSVSFTVGDDSTELDQLTITAWSSVLNVIDDEGLTVTGTGADRSLIIQPRENESGVTTITLNVSDGSNETRQTFGINVVAVNDAPGGSETALEFEVLENAPPDTALGSIRANFGDPDEGFGDTLTYTINSGGAAGVFALNETTGQLKVNEDGGLDYETASSYSLVIQATDQAGESATSNVNISVIAVDGDITESNDSLKTAYNLNSRSGLEFSEVLVRLSEGVGLSISSPTDDDYYYFTHESNNSLSLSAIFSSYDGDLDISLLDVNGEYLSSSASVSDNETVQVDGPGEYYLRVYGYAGAMADYELTTGSVGGVNVDSFEDNDEHNTASVMGAFSPNADGSWEGLTIDAPYDEDYYRFQVTGEGTTDVSLTVSFDHAQGDVDIQLQDANGMVINSSTSSSNQEIVTGDSLESGFYYLRVFGYGGDTSPDYSIRTVASEEELSSSADAYEKNENFLDAYSLGLVTGDSSNVVSNATIHSSTDEDFFSFTITDEQNLGLEVLFSHSDADLDIELLDSDGYWIDSASSVSDNEYLSLSGLAAGTYVLKVFGYAQATIDDYSVRFVDEVIEDWEATYDDWWDWQETVEASGIAADAYEQNDSASTAYDLDTISSDLEFADLTIEQAGDADWFKFTYDADTRLDISLVFDGQTSDIDLELYDANQNWIDGSYSVTGFEELTLAGLEGGDYYLHVYEYGDGLSEAYDLRFAATDAADASDLNDQAEPNDTFEDATDLGEASGEGLIADLTLTSGDEDWFQAFLVNDGTPNQYVSVLFDHSDGDIDLELYDADRNLLRSGTSVTDNETIYLSDIDSGQYYLRILSYGDTNFQEYSLDYAFPIDVGATTPDADGQEGDSGNDLYSAASSLTLTSALTDLTLHNATDQDWFQFATRNLSSTSSQIFVDYDDAFGVISLSLWAIEVGSTEPTMVTRTASGSGRERINFDGFGAGDYYLQVTAEDGALIPDYSLTMGIDEVEASQSASSVISADQFDSGDGNNTASDATSLGTLETVLTIEGLGIHSASDVDYLQFQTAFSGETQIDLTFSHQAGDLDTVLRNSSGAEVASSISGNDNESISFQSSSTETYTLEVYGYGGETNRDYDLTITPKQLNSRRDEYESNNSASQAVEARDTRASFNDLTLHDSTDQDWFQFTIADTANGTNKVQITNFLGADAELTIYRSNGTTAEASADIVNGAASIDASDFSAGDYYAVVNSLASASDPASSQVSNYNLYIDQSSGVAAETADSWTVMVYIAGDNNLASAAVDDLNEMEGVMLPENVNVVTLTDLSDSYITSVGWSDTRRGEIAPDPNGYNPYGWAGSYWASPADELTSDLESVGELNMGDPQTLTDFIDWSTTNHTAEKYALVIWDHGGGLSGIAWDDTDGHDNLDISEIKSAITDSTAFSADNSLDLVGFDACLMQTYEVGLELASIADVMVASQETEPGDGWDYQGFLNSLAANPYASSATLGGYIVDSYDGWYDSVSETLSSVDLSKYQAIDDAMTIFNTAALTASGSDWLTIDDAVEDAWSSAAWDYGWAGEEYDLGQFFSYIATNSANSTLQAAAAAVEDAIDVAVLDNSSRQDLSGIQAGLLLSNSSIWTGEGLIGKDGSAWGVFQSLYDVADRSVRSASAENLTPDYSETKDALGRASQGNNTSLTAFEIGSVSNTTSLTDLTIHNASDVDWYQFSTPTGLESVGNVLKVSSINTVALSVTLYDSDRSVLTQKAGVENNLDLSVASDYYLKVETSEGRQDIAYSIDVDLVLDETRSVTQVADLAEGSSSNDLLSKASELNFDTESDTSLSNLNLSLTAGDQDWFEISAGRISEQSPNLFSVTLVDDTVSADEDVIVEISNASGTVLASSTAVGLHETLIFEDYDSDIFISVRSETGKVLDYKLDLRHASYDVDGSGSVAGQTDGAAILSALFADSTASEVAGNLLEGTSGAASLDEFLASYSNTLLDVDGDGVTKASTDGVIINAYIAGASATDLLPFISSESPIQTADDLLTHLLDVV
ncbi:clostripain-related cysteine peptidase [Litorivicinus sp.]|nr:clostripain-related cysteine peptidase [Litorivicinus sp.]